MVKLFIRRLSADRISYEVARWFRISLALFGAVVIGGSITASGIGGGHWLSFPIVLAHFALFAAAYHEYWIFDRSKGQVVRHYGLLCYTRKSSYPLEGARKVRIVKVRKGGYAAVLFKAHRRIQLSLQLVYDHRDPVVIEEISQWRSGGHTEEAAGEIAEFLGLPVEHTGAAH